MNTYTYIVIDENNHYVKSFKDFDSAKKFIEDHYEAYSKAHDEWKRTARLIENKPPKGCENATCTMPYYWDNDPPQYIEYTYIEVPSE